MKADYETSTQFESIATKVIHIDEDGPGLYTVMIQMFETDGTEPLGRAGFGGKHKLYTLMSGPPYTTDYDVRRFLSYTQFTKPQSIIDDFLKAIHHDDGLFHQLVHGERYDKDMMEAFINGRG